MLRHAKWKTFQKAKPDNMNIVGFPYAHGLMLQPNGSDNLVDVIVIIDSHFWG